MMKKILLAFALLLCLVFSSACAAAQNMAPWPQAGSAPSTPALEVAKYDSGSGDYAYESVEPTAEAEASGGGFGGAGGLPAGLEARKVVTSAEFSISTDDFGAAMRRLEQKIAVSGSYIQQSENRAATEYSAAYASMTIRVPISLYGDFKAFLTNLALLDSASEHGDDVTVQYYDTEARLKVLQAQEERVKAFIANSKDLDEIFKIERELTSISTEIEQLTTVKNRLDNLTAYATVYVQIWEIAEAKVVEVAAFSEKVNNALQGSLKGIVVVAQFLFLLIIWCWPLLLLLGIALLIWRKFGNRTTKKGKNLPSAPLEVQKEE